MWGVLKAYAVSLNKLSIAIITSPHMSPFACRMVLQIAVVGAGAVGLSTALCIQEQLPTAQVTVIAEVFNKDTTSDGAAGLFRPNVNDLKNHESLLR